MPRPFVQLIPELIIPISENTTGGGSSGIAVEDTGTPIANNPHTTLNFTGSGVTATDSGGGVAQIAIPGGVTDYPQLPGATMNAYTASGTIALVVPTQTRLGEMTTAFVDGFTAQASSVSAAWVSIATLDLSVYAPSAIGDWSLSLVGFDSGSSGASLPVYRADVLFTAFYDGSGVILLPSSPTAANIRTNGTTTGYSVQLVLDGNVIEIQVQGGSGGHTVKWSCIGQVQWVS